MVSIWALRPDMKFRDEHPRWAHFVRDLRSEIKSLKFPRRNTIDIRDLKPWFEFEMEIHFSVFVRFWFYTWIKTREREREKCTNVYSLLFNFLLLSFCCRVHYVWTKISSGLCPFVIFHDRDNVWLDSMDLLPYFVHL